MVSIDVLVLRTAIADSIRQQVKENLDYMMEALRVYKFILDNMAERAEENMWRAQDTIREAIEAHARRVAEQFYKAYSAALQHDPSSQLRRALDTVTRTSNQLFNLAREIDRAETREEIRRLWRLVKEVIEDYARAEPVVPGMRMSQELLKTLLLLDDLVEEEARREASHRAPGSIGTRS